MKRRKTMANIAGILFIIVGVIASIVLVSSYDESYRVELEEGIELTVEEEFDLMELENKKTIMFYGAGAVLLFNVAIGLLLITLGNIQGTLEDMAFKEMKDREEKTDQD